MAILSIVCFFAGAWLVEFPDNEQTLLSELWVCCFFAAGWLVESSKALFPTKGIIESPDNEQTLLSQQSCIFVNYHYYILSIFN